MHAAVTMAVVSEAPWSRSLVHWVPDSRGFHSDTVNTVVLLAHILCMQIGLRHFRSATIDWLIGTVAE